jgi:hypothetical protein
MRHRWLRVSLFAMPTYNATINTGKQAVLLISRLQKALFFVSHGITHSIYDWLLGYFKI